ncbi:MAG: 3-deoxy-7-phosphoheptulonate synthase class II [Candidatus Nanopelagicales bacterium]|nr:3-deoxy-7-phosphoheptulonate synthase class II [Candidatus Nanopelagicales bacterium]
MTSPDIEWPDLPVAQQIPWVDEPAVAHVAAILRGVPALVQSAECDLLTQRLAAAERGEAFVLMAGDCAETFDANTITSIRARLRTVLQMAVVLTYGASLPVVKIGRMAGQYFKPRSRPTERRDGVELASYFGDAVNGLEFSADARTPDPDRMLRAYRASNAVMNLVRSFTQDGSADLRQVHTWNRDFVRESPAGRRYEELAAGIDRALAFMSACGADPEELRGVEFFVGHEALSLDYERSLVRFDPVSRRHFGSSGHFLWVGERTRQLDGAHVDFAATVNNPIGVKVGPSAHPDDVLGLIERLDPHRIPGRLTIISRMGAANIRGVLPDIVEKVIAAQHPVVWIFDPMHGNTRESDSGYKTRSFDDVVTEVKEFFAVHRSLGTHPGGLHVELTGDDVTECVGGTEGVAEADLSDRYETACDPRLNREQSLELAFLVAGMLSERTI